MTCELYTAEEMKAAEQCAIANGISEESLMEKAGLGVAEVIFQKFKPCPTLIFCGPGKNGGDGKVVARFLQEKGWPVDVIEFRKLPSFEEIDEKLEKAELVVDGLLGTGLSKPLMGDMLKLVQMINDAHKPVVAIDIPTGIETNTGAELGGAVQARYTVTFHRPRLGHYLIPGCEFTGELIVKDISISCEGLNRSPFSLNTPLLWNGYIKVPRPSDHKYSRGTCLVVGAGCMPGAVKLATRASRRVGAGLVRLMCKAEEYPIFATTAWGEIITPVAKAEEFLEWILDPRFSALLWGTGALPKTSTCEQAIVLLSSKKPCVLDGGALSCFEDSTQELKLHLHPNVVLTPHEGEFHRLFPHLAFLNDKVEKAVKAAIESGVVVVLKGHDTIIASPTGQVIINANAPAALSTAGTGDVLAGLITGLLAQGIPPFFAAAAGVWIHGEAANRIGLGLIAEDISEKVPEVLRFLQALKSH